MKMSVGVMPIAPRSFMMARYSGRSNGTARKNGDLDVRAVLGLSGRYMEMLWLVLNEPDIPIMFGKLQCFSLCEVDSLDDRLHLFGRPTFSHFNFYVRHSYCGPDVTQRVSSLTIIGAWKQPFGLLG